MPFPSEMNGAGILLLLREGKRDFKELLAAYGFNESSAASFGMFLSQRLGELKAAGLVDFDTDPQRPYAYPGSIQVSDHWTQVQTALGGPRLKDLHAITHPQSMVTRPVFERRDVKTPFADVFVLMPFLPEMKWIYDGHLAKVAKNLGLSVARADDFFTAHAVIQDIWESICAARLLIADCTGKNPNVFYEIGMAHVLGKKVVLITQNPADVPADVGHLRYIQYQTTPPEMHKFEQALERTLRTELEMPAQA